MMMSSHPEKKIEAEKINESAHLSFLKALLNREKGEEKAALMGMLSEESQN